MSEHTEPLGKDRVREILEVARALDDPAGYGPPLTLRGTVRECHDHGERHWHFEAVATLPGGIIAHYFDPAHYSTERVALAVFGHFAEACGIADPQIVPHPCFVHSTQPEVDRLESGGEHSHGLCL